MGKEKGQQGRNMRWWSMPCSTCIAANQNADCLSRIQLPTHTRKQQQSTLQDGVDGRLQICEAQDLV